MINDIAIAPGVFVDSEGEDFVFKYYNQFFRLDPRNSVLSPIPGNKVDDTKIVYKVQVNASNPLTDPRNTPVVYVKSKNEYGVIIDKSYTIGEDDIVFTIRLLSSYFGIDNIIEKTISPIDKIEVLSLIRIDND